MGRYYETRQQECFGVALANFLLRYEGEEFAHEVMGQYWKQPFVESDGATDALFTPYLVRVLTRGLYAASVTLTREPDYDALHAKYGGGIGMALPGLGDGSIRYVDRITELQVPCIALLENSIDSVDAAGNKGKYLLNSHAVLALGGHWYIDYGQFIHDDKSKVIGAVHLRQSRDPLKDICAERGIPYPLQEPNIWKL